MKANKTILSLTLLLLSAIMYTACDDTDAPQTRKAVIEGVINSGDYPSVLFSASVAPGIDGSLKETVINWGKVTISDGEREVVLTGKVDNAYMPPYRYYTTEMIGEPGKTYTITADFADLHAAASMRMPYPTAIDSITLSQTTDSLFAATLHFTSPDDTPAYYYLTMAEDRKGSVHRLCMMGTIRADVPGKHYSVPVLRPKVKIDSVKYIAQLKLGEEWNIRLNRVEKEVYDFWTAYDNMILFSASPFISTDESLPTNINGGYGIWSPQGSTSTDIIVAN